MDEEDGAHPSWAYPHHRKRSSPLSIKLIKYGIYLFVILCFFSLGYLFASTAPNYRLTPAQQETDDHNSFNNVCRPPVAPNQARKFIVDRVFQGTSPWEGFPPAHVVPLVQSHRINGWGSNAAVVEKLLREVKPKTIIEIGTFLGASALHMVNLTKKYGLADAQVICIDDFRGWPQFQAEFPDIKFENGNVLLMDQFMQNVVYSEATESIMFMPFFSGSAIEQLCSWGVYGDIVEVDAGLDFHNVWADINRAYKILTPGTGVLFGHDYFSEADDFGVRRAIHLFARFKNLTIQIDGEHWVIHPHPILSA